MYLILNFGFNVEGANIKTTKFKTFILYYHAEILVLLSRSYYTFYLSTMLQGIVKMGVYEYLFAININPALL